MTEAATHLLRIERKGSSTELLVPIGPRLPFVVHNGPRGAWPTNARHALLVGRERNGGAGSAMVTIFLQAGVHPFVRPDPYGGAWMYKDGRSIQLRGTIFSADLSVLIDDLTIRLAPTLVDAGVLAALPTNDDRCALMESWGHGLRLADVEPPDQAFREHASATEAQVRERQASSLANFAAFIRAQAERTMSTQFTLVVEETPEASGLTRGQVLPVASQTSVTAVNPAHVPIHTSTDDILFLGEGGGAVLAPAADVVVLVWPGCNTLQGSPQGGAATICAGTRFKIAGTTFVLGGSAARSLEPPRSLIGRSVLGARVLKMNGATAQLEDTGNDLDLTLAIRLARREPLTLAAGALAQALDLPPSPRARLAALSVAASDGSSRVAGNLTLKTEALVVHKLILEAQQSTHPTVGMSPLRNAEVVADLPLALAADRTVRFAMGGIPVGKGRGECVVTAVTDDGVHHVGAICWNDRPDWEHPLLR